MWWPLVLLLLPITAQEFIPLFDGDDLNITDDLDEIPPHEDDPFGRRCDGNGRHAKHHCGDLICRNRRCDYCESNEECAFEPERVCLTIGTVRRVCGHKHLIPPDARDWAALGLSIFVCAIAAGGGIGGGGLLLPLLVLVLSLTPHDAAPLTNATVLGGAVANLGFNVGRKHPSGRQKPLIAYEVALMMEPMTVAGAIAGVLLNKVLPGWLITVSLIVVLGVTTERTLRRGLAGWYQEAAAAAIAKTSPSVTAGLLPSPYPPAYPTPEATRTASHSHGHGALARGPSAGPESAGSREEGEAEEGAAEGSTTAHDVGILVVALGSCILLAMLRGSNQRTSWLDCACGSVTYWLLTLAQFLLLVLVSMRVRTTLLHRHARRVAMNYQFLPDDVQWSEENSLRYPIICAVAGLCAGLFGIGGGIVKGPLMLEMGMLPSVSAATAAYMILFTSAAATLQFALIGDLRPHYALALFCCGLGGTVVGQLVISSLLKRSGRHSLIVLIIAFIIGASTLIMGVAGVAAFLSDLDEGKSLGLRPLCESSIIDS